MAVVVVAASGTDQTAPSDNARRPLDLQLLMAARCGDSKQLKELLRLEEEDQEEEEAATEVVIVDVVPQRPPPAAAAAAAPPSPDPSGAASLQPPLDRVLTMEGDTLLHVLAACGDDEDFLHCAKMIIVGAKSRGEGGGRAAATRRKALLEACNREGDTPLHRAASAGNAKMISCLVDLASSTGDGGAAVAFLRMQNHRGETALHQAIRAAASANKLSCVDRLMALDSGLACITDAEGGSPLYLAITLGEVDIAQHLLEASKSKLSYSGPGGRNVLHAAVSCGRRRALPLVLEWLKKLKVRPRGGQGELHDEMGSYSVAADLLSELTSQQDKENGSTPVHLAASLWGLPSAKASIPPSSWVRSAKSATMQLLDANKSMMYQPDNKGLYPIHVAASVGAKRIVQDLLKSCPDCATLQDAEGRTFLHIAVEKQWSNVVSYVCRTRELSSILNVQDKNGDTALHRAVHAGVLYVFRRLILNPKVRLDVPNKEGMTPIDVSWSIMPVKAYYAWDPRIHIRKSLLALAAPYGEGRGDLFYEKHNVINSKFKGGEDKISEDLTASAQVMGIFSVLITTVTFASAFTLPGGYRSAGDGGGVAGTPVLAGSYAFDAFILSNTLAFICSLFATSLLLYAGVPAGTLQSRFFLMNASYTFMMNSGRSLVAAFALGLYVVLHPVSRMIPIVIIVGMVILGFGGLLKASEGIDSVLTFPIIRRSRKPSLNEVVFDGILRGIQYFWSFLLIFGIPAIRKWAKAR